MVTWRRPLRRRRRYSLVRAALFRDETFGVTPSLSDICHILPDQEVVIGLIGVVVRASAPTAGRPIRDPKCGGRTATFALRAGGSDGCLRITPSLDRRGWGSNPSRNALPGAGPRLALSGAHEESNVGANGELPAHTFRDEIVN